MKKKTIFSIFLILLLLSLSSKVFAKAGPPIPKPQISIVEAIKIAEDYFYSGKSSVIDNVSYKIKEYILVSVEYTTYFMEEHQREWAWKIRFVHPIANDNSITFKVTSDGKIFEQEITT